MSMNLHCNNMELLQTPTHITYMCLMRHNGVKCGKVKDKDMQRALRIYAQWVESTISSCITRNKKEEDQFNERCDFVSSHCREVMKVMKKKSTVVWFQ